MSRFYFHFRMDGELFPDFIGQNFNDLAAAHSHAIVLASRVMSYCEVEDRAPRTERWVVTIENDAGRVLMSVIIRCESSAFDIRRVPTRHSRLASGPTRLGRATLPVWVRQ
jgi:hypothetical protein